MRRSALAVLLVVLVMVTPSFFAGDMSRASSGGVGPMAAPFGTDPVWTDPLDDLSHVYVPPGGLVGVEVLGGEARLKATDTEGWVASSIIACPPGYRYDMAYVEVDAPGASKVLVTVLDATKDPDEVGYANRTVANHVKVEGVDHALDDIGPTDFPEIRIQVNLQSSGADRPRLLAWTVFFIEPDEWRDEFLGTGRMQSLARLNVTGGQAAINTGMRNTYTLNYADYSAYPPILANEVDQSNQFVFYPNPGHTAYGGRTTIAGGACAVPIRASVSRAMAMPSRFIPTQDFSSAWDRSDADLGNLPASSCSSPRKPSAR